MFKKAARKGLLLELVLFVIDNINISKKQIYMFWWEVAQSLSLRSGNNIVGWIIIENIN